MIDNSLQMIGLYISVNLLMNLLLAYLVSSRRIKSQVTTGTGDYEPLYKASRAHIVNSEYTPIGLIGLITLFILSASVWVIHVVGVALTLGRIFHAIGLLRTPGNSPPRTMGTLLTWAGQLIAALGCLYYTVTWLPA